VLFRAAAVVWLKCSLRHNYSPLTSPESENLEFTPNLAQMSKKGDEIHSTDINILYGHVVGEAEVMKDGSSVG
jgi:hypothetical protein